VQRFEQFVLGEEQILECHDVTGEDSYILKVRTDSPLTLRGLLAKLRMLAGVTHTVTSIVLTTVKEENVRGPHLAGLRRSHEYETVVVFVDTGDILWASSYVAAKFVLRELSVTMMLAFRLGIAALLLLPWLVGEAQDLQLTRKDVWRLGVLVLIGFVVNKLLEFGGLALTTASDVALLISGESLFTAALSWLR